MSTQSELQLLNLRFGKKQNTTNSGVQPFVVVALWRRERMAQMDVLLKETGLDAHLQVRCQSRP